MRFPVKHHVNFDPPSDFFPSLEKEVCWIFDHVLDNTASFWMPEPNPSNYRPQPGDHRHEAWEIFCPLSGRLSFACAGSSLQRFPVGSLLLVPPGILHRSIHELDQPKHVRILVLDLPGAAHTHGTLSLGSIRRQRRHILSPFERAQWVERIGLAPDILMKRVARGLRREDRWGHEQALAQIRLLFSAFMEMANLATKDRRKATDRHVTSLLAFLQTRYYDRSLDARAIANAMGFSPSYLRRIVREQTGKALHRTLTDIRLEHARDLLKKSPYSIKEISYLTGWSNPLYFSAAFHKNCGVCPSLFRARHKPNPPKTENKNRIHGAPPRPDA